MVLPLGAAAKEHGPHLLLRNDEILAEYYARRVVEARPVAVLPTLTYGFYPAFLEYPGSVSLSDDTQRDAVVEIVRSIARHGPAALLRPQHRRLHGAAPEGQRRRLAGRGAS